MGSSTTHDFKMWSSTLLFHVKSDCSVANINQLEVDTLYEYCLSEITELPQLPVLKSRR